MLIALLILWEGPGATLPELEVSFPSVSSSAEWASLGKFFKESEGHEAGWVGTAAPALGAAGSSPALGVDVA